MRDLLTVRGLVCVRVRARRKRKDQEEVDRTRAAFESVLLLLAGAQHMGLSPREAREPSIPLIFRPPRLLLLLLARACPQEPRQCRTRTAVLFGFLRADAGGWGD